MSSALAFLLMAGVLFWLAVSLRNRAGIPWARIVDQDMGNEQPCTAPLFDPHHRLTGRPDYLIQVGLHQIPIEVKPGRHAEQPYESDIMQVLAYCLLVEATTGCVPPYGILRYAHTSFRVAYTPAGRARLLNILDDMRYDMTQDVCERSHTDPRRCRGCGFAAVCDDALYEAVG